MSYGGDVDLCFGDLNKANDMLLNIRKNLAAHIQQLELCKAPIHFDEARKQLHSLQTVLHYLHQDDLAAEMKNFETQIQQNNFSSTEIISSINLAIQLLRAL